MVYKLDEQTIDRIAKYLFTKPWGEVNDIIVDINNQIMAQKTEQTIVPNKPEDK